MSTQPPVAEAPNRWERHLGFDTTQEQADLVAAVASKHRRPKGDVLRLAVHFGLDRADRAMNQGRIPI